MTHDSCLELLAQRPGLSNSELARGTFVTRQSMNVLLQALKPTRLTQRGRESLATATAAARSVEVRMLGGMTPDEHARAFTLLRSMIESLRNDSEGEPR